MKKTRNLLFVSLFIIGLLAFSSTASAWGPHTHTWLTEQLFERGNSEIIREVNQTEICRDAFLAGSMLPDITVAYYFSGGGAKYRATHNWNFQEQLMSQAKTPDERALAYGVASHLVADSVSHTMCIPERIKAYKMPNWLIHPLTEKKYDSLLALDNPGLKDRSKHMLDAILPSIDKHGKADRYIEMVEKALGPNSDFDIETNIELLGHALDSFYKEGGKRPDGGGLFALYPAIDAMTDWVYPLSTGSMDYVDYYVQKSLQENENVFNNWGGRTALSPHGFDELSEADSQAVGVFHIVFFTYIALMFALPLFFFWWRRNWLFLFLLPIMFFILILVMLIIYIIV